MSVKNEVQSFTDRQILGMWAHHYEEDDWAAWETTEEGIAVALEIRRRGLDGHPIDAEEKS